ncbi:hypothetical protein N0V88_001506 [Collariella sp. IMI 366227]|nr:hypothetical protein N0V88_001506 [Collariella sp. IMI 366227]
MSYNDDQNGKYIRYLDEKPKMPAAPAASTMADSPLLKELRRSVAKETKAFTFTCGGTIPIVAALPEVGGVSRLEPKDEAAADSGDEAFSDTDTASEDLRSTSCLPIDLRWDPTDVSVQSRQSKITFPLEASTEGNLQQLVKDMVPATFGLGGQDVYDELYRKAGKLDPTQFSSTFNPYELGIVDAIAQALLPSLRHAKQTRAVKAELYKLNLYSGPSGKFKAHVDTPRSPAQFGSLVVCLPVSFQGGALEVRHKGKTLSFDWSNSAVNGNEPAIRWAAFYSDCEHEIFEVTDGHRLTLTYNLYSVRGNGQLGGNVPWLDPTQLPLYRTIRDLVGDREGWKEGGLIGYNCSHVYPHSNKSPLNLMIPDNLKGADMLMFEIFRSLGLGVRFRPVVHTKDDPYDRWCAGDPLPLVGLKLKHETWESELEGWYSDSAWDEWAGRFERPQNRWDQAEEESDEYYENKSVNYVDFFKVHWLNDWGHQEEQVHWIAYGNQACNTVTYSCVAMIVEIPPSVNAQDAEKEVETVEAE